MRSHFLPRLARINLIPVSLAVLSLGLLSRTASAATLGVPSQYATIQSAVNASQNGDTVLIADGTYTGPGNVDIDFGSKNITVTSQHGAASTTINCGGSASAFHRGFYLHSGETNAVISGLTIQNGYEDPYNTTYGGGIYVSAAGVTVQNCILKNDEAEYGGGISNSGGTSPVILTNCVFIGNQATEGGGLNNVNFNGGLTSVANCTFTANQVYGDGGSLYSYTASGAAITLTNDISFSDVLIGGGSSEVKAYTAQITKCDIQGGLPAGTTDNGGNLNADPLFVSSPTDLHLQPGSPCLGAGTASGAPTTTIDGKTRPAPPSIGAYEAAANGTPTATKLVSNLNPSVFGQAITFTQTVTGNNPSGSITLTDTTTGTVLGAGSENGGGPAAYTVSSLSVGTHQIVASYAGNSTNSPSTSPPLTQVVSSARTTTTLTSSANPALAGQNITFTANVSSGSGGTPSGYVTFIVDGTAGAPVTLSNGYYAAFSTSSLSVGSHTITAAYSGDSSFSPSTSAALTQTVSKNQATTVLTSSLDPSVVGAVVKLTAAVTGSGGSATGTVTFTIDGAAQPAVTLVGRGTLTGYADYTTSSLALGSHTVTAAYSGDSSFASNVSPILTQVVNPHLSPQYVSPSGSDSNSGTQAAPKLTIQAAMNASLSGDTVIVEDGVYSQPGDVNLDFGGQGLAVMSQNGPATTIIDCEYGATQRGFILDSGEIGAVIKGLTIENGFQYGSGGGIYNASAGLTVQNCVFKSDTAGANGTGGGIYNAGSGTTTITGCTFTGDYGSGSGGGIYNNNTGTATILVTNCTFSGNNADSGYGGGIFNFNNGTGTITVTGCTFTANTSVYGGGGVYNSNSASGAITLINCSLTSNSGSGFYGGGVSNYNAGTGTIAALNSTISGNGANSGGGVFNNNTSTGAITFSGCIITGNTATYGDGGGLYDSNTGTIAITNCVIAGNMEQSQYYVGGVLYSTNTNSRVSGGTATLTNCTLTGNASFSGGGIYNDPTNGGSVSLLNDILTGDTGNEIVGAGVSTANCDIQGGYAGTSNINADPLFVIPPGQGGFPDLHLQYGSPCVGAGTASSAPATTIDGKTRPAPPSMGAYEAAMTATATALASNLNPSTAGQSVTFTASVTGTSGTPTGTVTLTLDGTAQTPVTLVAGQAAFNTSGLSAGSHNLSAAYSGDQFNAAGTSAVLTQTVSAPPVNQVRFVPRAGYASRMVGGVFQGSHDGSTYTTLATVTQAPPNGQYSTLPTSADPASFRFLRYLAPNGAYGNVAEVEFDSSGVKLTGTGFGTPGSYANSGNDFTKALDGNASTFFDAPAPGNGDYVGIDRTSFTKLTGTVFGTPGSYANSGNDITKVFDGSLSTFFDAPLSPGNGDYAGIDLGAGGTAVVTRIRYCPRAGYASRMVGGLFQGSSDMTAWTTLYTVASAPASGGLTQTTAISSSASYRYLRYLGPNGSYGNVAEVEFDTSP